LGGAAPAGVDQPPSDWDDAGLWGAAGDG